MTQPDFSGTFEGRFVDDDNLRESGRVWVEFDNGGGEMSVPIDPESANAALAEISAAGDNAVQAIGTEVSRAEDAADRAESAVNTGVGDGAVTLAKLAQDVKDVLLAETKGPKGDPGITPHVQDETWWVGDTDTGIRAQGPKGDPGPTGTLDLIDESAQTTIDTVVVPAIEGARDEALGQVAGAVAAELDYFEERMVPLAEPPNPNLVDSSTTTVGILETSGNILPTSNRQVTDWISVIPGSQYVSWSGMKMEEGIIGGHRLLFFDANKNVLTGQDTSYRDGQMVHQWTAPETAEFVRIGMSPMPVPNPPLGEVLIFNQGTELWDPDAPVDISWWNDKVIPPRGVVSLDDLNFSLDDLIDQRVEEKITTALDFLTKPLSYPAGFAEVPITLSERFDGVITHDMNFDDIRTPAGASHIYFDGTGTGDAGTLQSPYRGWTEVVAAVNDAAGDVVVHVLNDFSSRVAAATSVEMVISGKNVSIVSDAPSGRSWLTAANAALAWVQDGTVWTTSRTGATGVFSAEMDEHGIPIPLHSASTMEECRSTAKSWWTDGSVVAVNSPSRPTVQTHHITMSVPAAARYSIENDGTLYMENISFLAGNTVNIRGDATGTAIFNKVFFIGGDMRNEDGVFGNGLNLTDVKTTLSFGCIAAHSPRDGFNYHYANTPVEQRRGCLAFEYDCLAYNLGPYSTAWNNNATTAHEGISVLRVGTVGRGMSGPALADVGGCLSVNYACDMSGGTRNYAFEAGEAWLHDCISRSPVYEHVLLTQDAILHGEPIIR